MSAYNNQARANFSCIFLKVGYVHKLLDIEIACECGFLSASSVRVLIKGSKNTTKMYHLLFYKNITAGKCLLHPFSQHSQHCI